MDQPEEPKDRFEGSPPTPAPQLKAVESQLAALRPREDRLDRERLMYLAGQASVGRRRRSWPAAFSAMTAAAAALLMAALFEQSELSTVRRTLSDVQAAAAGRSRPSIASSERAPRSMAPSSGLDLRAAARQPIVGVYTAGMPLSRMDLQVASESGFSAGQRNDTGQERPAVPVLSTRSLDDALSGVTNPKS